MELSNEQAERYSRHIVLKGVGIEGQKKLLNGCVFIIGAGGLGSPAAMYLAAAGVGTIGIADADSVDLSNLQRQIIHTSNDLGRDKVLSAEETLLSINPDITVNAYGVRVTQDNISCLISGYDFVLDCSDNFATKFLINDACVKARIPFSHAGISGFQGQLMTYVPDEGPCYRCIFKEPPPDGAVPDGRQTGVIGALCGVVGSMQAMEAVKYLIGEGELLTGCMLTYDAMNADFRKIKLPEKVNDCSVCKGR